jgi:Ca2+-binding RTX toxin-like protein
MIGGMGDDTYVVDSTGDVVTEASGEGIDLVQSTISYTLGANIEWLLLDDGGSYDGTGNSLDNIIIGNDDANVLDGGDGDDVLDGAAGNDTLTGGAGNDTYYINGGTDTVVESFGGGADSVISSLASYTLPNWVENLKLELSAATGLGNSLANQIEGNASANALAGLGGADVITGLGGDDTILGGNGDDELNGGDGADELTGGGDDDRFVFDSVAAIGSGATRDVITDFESTTEDDVIDLSAIDAIAGGSDDAFSFIGTAAFSASAGELRYFSLWGDVYIQGDDDGDGLADFTLELAGVASVSAADFDL